MDYINAKNSNFTSIEQNVLNGAVEKVLRSGAYNRDNPDEVTDLCYTVVDMWDKLGQPADSEFIASYITDEDIPW